MLAFLRSPILHGLDSISPCFSNWGSGSTRFVAEWDWTSSHTMIIFCVLATQKETLLTGHQKRSIGCFYTFLVALRCDCTN